MKEYVLQVYEKRFSRAVTLLKKYSERDNEVKTLLKEIAGNDVDKKKIANVVEENERISSELKIAKERVIELERKYNELANETCYERQVLKKLTGETSIKRLAKKIMPNNMFATSPQASPRSITSRQADAFNGALSLFCLDKEKISNRINLLEKENKGLLRLNEKLKKDLNRAYEELFKFKGKKKDSFIKSIVSCSPGDELDLRMKQSIAGVVLAQGGSFIDMSSIREDFLFDSPDKKIRIVIYIHYKPHSLIFSRFE